MDDCAIAEESSGDGETLGRYVTNGCLNVVRYPVDEIRAVLVLNVEHLVLDLFHRHLTSEDRCHREVPSRKSLFCKQKFHI